MASVTMGHRPECPFNDPSQGLSDLLWDQIEACWHDDPEQRPAALAVLQFLQSLNRDGTLEEPREFQEPQEYQEPQSPQEPHKFQEPQELLELLDESSWDDIGNAPELRAFGFFAVTNRWTDVLTAFLPFFGNSRF